MDQLKAMRVFARVIDEGSFAKAARAMDLAPAVVTRLVAELEEHLGARLINRTTRRLALTDIGESYLERTRGILADLDEAEALASASTAEPRGHLRVLVPPGFAVHQLAKHLPRFRGQYPRVTIELSVPGPVETVDVQDGVRARGAPSAGARRPPRHRATPPRPHRDARRRLPRRPGSDRLPERAVRG